MNPILIAAILNAAVKFGMDVVATLLEQINTPGATIDDAITALRKAAATPLHTPPVPPV